MKKSFLALLLLSSVFSSAHSAYFFKDTAKRYTVSGDQCQFGDIKILGQAEVELFGDDMATLYVDAHHMGDDFQMEYLFIKSYWPSDMHDYVEGKAVEVKQSWKHRSKSFSSTRKVLADGLLIETTNYSLEKGANGRLILKDSAFNSVCELLPTK